MSAAWHANKRKNVKSIVIRSTIFITTVTLTNSHQLRSGKGGVILLATVIRIGYMLFNHVSMMMTMTMTMI